jgi:Domain of unknown function (DUF4268)
MTTLLGRLEKVELREVWGSEASHFTPWLATAENLAILGDTVDYDLEVEAQEKEVGPFRADVLCKDLRSGNWVLIENQLERTDHVHLGQLLVYASGLKAVTIVWVARTFTEEHRATLDWLNAITDDEFRFFGLEVELWRIANSPPAPKFNIVCKPNNWSRSVTNAAQRIESEELSETKRTQLEFWTGFRQFLSDQKSTLRSPEPRPQHWANFSAGRSGFRFDAYALVRDSGIGVNLVIYSDQAKPFFKLLLTEKEKIEAELGRPLQWRELPGNKESQIYTGPQPADFSQRSKWPEYYAWLKDTLERFAAVFGPRIKNLRADDWIDDIGGDTQAEISQAAE